MIPKFAIIGEPNEGKSTLVSTLAEDENAKVGAVAGTTKRRATYKAKIGSEELMEFTDTPGFQNTPEIEYWFEKQPRYVTDLPAKFVLEYGNDPNFSHDCEIMRALSGDDVAMIYVVDGTKPISDEDRSQISFLPRCSSKRMAVINLKSNDTRYLKEWKKLLGTAFGTYKEFNALRAGFTDRMGLLGDLASVIQDWKDPMSRIISLYKEDWQDRLDKSAEVLIEMIEDTLSARVYSPVSNDHTRRYAAEEKIQKQLQQKIRALETKFQKTILKTFHHEKPLWKHEEAKILAEDIFSEEAWEFLGLSKGKLRWAGAISGAITGGLIDAAVGGASFLIGTLVGTASGLVLAWMKAGKAIEFQIRKTPLGRISAKSSHEQVAHINHRSNLIWIMIDRALSFVELTSKWAHGDRTYAAARDRESTNHCFTNHWTKAEREIMIEWTGHLTREKKDPEKIRKIKNKVFEVLVSKLNDITQSEEE